MYEGCERLKHELEEVEAWFIRLETSPIEGDEDYDSETARISEVLHSATEAYQNRPTECKMADLSDDRYECRDCNFNVHISTE